MAPQIGTHDISTLLAARFQSAAEFGLDTIAQVLQADIAAHNAVVDELMNELVTDTTDRQRIYGTTTGGEMVEVDEYARSATQRQLPGETTAFPLSLFQFAVGWTEKYFETATPADMAMMTINAQGAHLRMMRRKIMTALFTPTNYTTYDHLVDNISLGVKALVNADGASIPRAPDAATTFDGSTHTHYDAINGLTANALTALVNDVVEHGHGNNVIIAINLADEAAVRALTGFTAYLDARISTPAYNVNVPNRRTDYGDMYNRPIGLFGAAEVWIKPWMIANYAFAWDAGSPLKPLVRRQRPQSRLRGLRVASVLNNYPLVAQHLEAEFGFGVWTRTNGAILYFGSGTYATPTIA